MSHVGDILSLAYIVDALLLIALTDRLASARPLAKAFVLLASVAIVGTVVGDHPTRHHVLMRAALVSAAPAACAWSVLATCRPTTRATWFVPIAVISWTLAMRLPNDATPVEFLGAVVPLWQCAAGLYWFGVWAAWSAASLVGWWLLLRAPIGVAHIMGGLVAVSVATEAVGILAWSVRPDWYVLTQSVDLALAVLLGVVATYALRTSSP